MLRVARHINSELASLTLIMSESYLDRVYRSAIALNNMAVSLQRKGKEKQAVETFRDALAAIRLSSRQHRTAGETSDVEGKVQVASQRMSLPVTSINNDMFEIVSDDQEILRLSGLAKGDAISSGPTLIRIEEYGGDNFSVRNLDLDAGIILHNYGISILFMAVKNSKASSQEHLQCHHDAIKLLTLSYQVVSAYALERTDDNLLHKLLLVATVVTRSMAHAFHSLDFEWKVKECLEHLDAIFAVAHSTLVMGCSGLSRGNVASAA
jgi:hypothetical protein